MFDDGLKQEVLARLDMMIANLRLKGEHYRVAKLERLKEKIRNG